MTKLQIWQSSKPQSILLKQEKKTALRKDLEHSLVTDFGIRIERSRAQGSKFSEASYETLNQENILKKWKNLNQDSLKVIIDSEKISVQAGSPYEINYEDLNKSIFASHAIRLAKSINNSDETNIFFDFSKNIELDKKIISDLCYLFCSLRVVRSLWFLNCPTEFQEHKKNTRFIIKNSLRFMLISGTRKEK